MQFQIGFHNSKREYDELVYFCKNEKVYPNKALLNTLSDLELVLCYAESEDRECVGILFKRYSSLVYSVCLKYLEDREESKDAVMQIFEKLLVDLKRHSIINFKSWLHSVARNHCLMELRKNKGIIKIGGETAEYITPIMDYRAYLHQEDEHEKEINLTEIEGAILELNTEQKVCIELFYIQEKSYQEITTITGYSLNNVKSYIQNGKRNLKNRITQGNVVRK